MRPELAARASQQDGLVTRRQAVEAGYSERELRTLTAVTGAWVVVRRGVYVERTLWESCEYDDQWRLRDRAAHLAMTQVHLMSHDSAARAHGLPLLRPQLPLVHVTRPGVGGSRTEHGVKHHLGKRIPAVEVVDSLPVTNLARTVIDVGREHGLDAGVVAADAAARRGVTELDFRRELAMQTSWPRIATARAAVGLRDGGAESPGESLARLLVIELGIGEPQTQFPVEVEHRVFWTDLLVGLHVFEFDGRIKYRREGEGGVSQIPADQVVWNEKRRQRLICSQGLGMSRILWEDFEGPARRRALQRLRAEYDVTLARFGDVLPERLAATARRLAGRRRA